MSRAKGQGARTFSEARRRELLRGYDRAVRARRGGDFLEKHKIGSSHISHWRKLEQRPARARRGPRVARAPMVFSHPAPILRTRTPPVVDINRVREVTMAALKYHQAQASYCKAMMELLDNPVRL